MYNNISNRKSFSLLEMIFSIMVLAVLSSLAVPKFMEMLSDAKVSVVKQDIGTIVSSVRNYYLVKGKSDKIGDIVSINSSTWSITDTEVTYKEDEKICISIKILQNKTTLQDYISVTIDPTVGNICNRLSKGGIVNEDFFLN
jgi:type II secretory pathway pseudopilin PulG